MAKIERLKDASLLLDEDNPRLGKLPAGQRWTQPMIYAYFAGLPKLQALARDIAQRGTNPSKRPIVTPAEGKKGMYVVLEGNRRLAASRLLTDPSLAGGGPAQSAFKKLKENAVPRPAEIECVVMPSREAADHWVRMEHGLGKDGTATLEWGPSEKSRYQERVVGEGRYYRSTALVDTLAEAGLIDSATVRKVPITTLDRMLTDPDFRAGLKLNFDEGLRIDNSNRDAIIRVVKDIASGGVKVGAVMKKEQREKYLKQVLGDPKGAAPVTTKAGTGGRSKAQKPHFDRKHVIPTDFRPKFPKKQPRLTEVYTELRQLNTESSPNACALLMRTFVELAVNGYYAHKAWATPGTLATMIKKSAQDLEKLGKITQGAASVVVRAADDDDSFVSVKALHQFVHGPYDLPSPKQLHRIWTGFQPYLAALLEAQI